MRKRMPRALIVIAVALVAFAVPGGTTAGHAGYVRSDPAPEARLAQPPAAVTIEFSELPDAAGSEIHVISAAGQRVDGGALDARGNALSIAVGGLSDAGYVVTWRARSAVDGHTASGSFVFAVGSASLPALADPAATPAPSASQVVGKTLSYSGIAVALGVALFGLVVAAPGSRAARRRERRLIGAAALALVAGSVLQGVGGVPERIGLLLAVRAATGAGILLLVAGAARHLSPHRERMLVVALAAAAGMTASLSAHAAATGAPLLVLLDLAHVIAVSAWLGGIVALAFVVLPDARAAGATGLAVATTLRRFARLAIAAVALLVATGIAQSLDRLSSPQDLVETAFGVTLLAKSVLLLATGAIGLLNLRILGPRLARRGGAARGLGRAARVEVALLAVALAASALLGSLTPPAQARATGLDHVAHADGLRVELALAKSEAGRNRYTVRVTSGLATVTAERVVLRFSLPERAIAEREVVAEPRGAGEFVSEGSLTSAAGTWQVVALVRRAERDDARAVFRVPIASASTVGPARLEAGRYRMVVSDPERAEPGGPLALVVELRDAEGALVTGRPVTGILAYAGTEPGHEHADLVISSEIAPGSYRMLMGALDDGPWRLTIAVGNEARAEYRFHSGV